MKTMIVGRGEKVDLVVRDNVKAEKKTCRGSLDRLRRTKNRDVVTSRSTDKKPAAKIQVPMYFRTPSPHQSMHLDDFD